MRERTVLPTQTVVFGNTWQGRLIDEHLDEIYAYSAAVDLGFFSEVLHFESDSGEPLRAYDQEGGKQYPMTVNQFTLLARYLGEFECHHAPARMHQVTCATSGRRYQQVAFGNARCFRVTLPVLDHGSSVVYGTLGEKGANGVNPRALDYAVLGGEEHTILAHLHGLWIKDNTKGDAPERDEQSEGVRRILRILAEQYDTDRIILGGDFNLDLDTRALRHLEEGNGAKDVPLRNLIRENGFTSTRMPIYRKYNEEGASLYADYVLVSDTIEVVEFTVKPDSASDHMHLLLSWR